MVANPFRVEPKGLLAVAVLGRAKLEISSLWALIGAKLDEPSCSH